MYNLKKFQGWWCDSVVGHLLNLFEALGSVYSTTGKKILKRIWNPAARTQGSLVHWKMNEREKDTVSQAKD